MNLLSIGYQEQNTLVVYESHISTLPKNQSASKGNQADEILKGIELPQGHETPISGGEKSGRHAPQQALYRPTRCQLNCYKLHSTM
jgi:hypothetical protein